MHVLDFGIAAAVRAVDDGAPPAEIEEHGVTQELAPQAAGSQGPPALATMTRPGALLGTLPYMASEQLAGLRADARADQFAFCVALWEALAGARPFAGRSPEALRRSIADGPDVGAITPRWLRKILVRGLADDPRRRWPDMHALVAAIQRGQRRRRMLWSAVGVAAVVAVVIAGRAIWGAAARAARETRADARLTVLRGELAGLRARGEDDDAARLLRTFVELPDNRDTAAPARAHLEWGDAMTDHVAAVDAYASAYMAARTPADAHAALRGLVARLYAGGALQEVAAALAVLGREDPATHADPTLARPRLAAALHRRDIAAASAALMRGPEAERGWVPVLEDLSHVTIHERERLGVDREGLLIMQAADLDGDGRREIVSNGLGPGGDVTVILGAEPALPVWRRVQWREPARGITPLPHTIAGTPLLLTTHAQGAGHRTQMTRVDGDAPLAVATWTEPDEAPWFSGAAADLDGDGALELYVGTGPYRRRLSRYDHGPAGWTRVVANLATDAVRSDLHTLAAGDLDDDGRPELVAAAGPWTAYDLRVLRARPGARPGVDDSLELVARRSFGQIGAVMLPRRHGGRRIALVKLDSDIDPRRFSPEQPLGEPAGLYVVELRGEALEVVEHVPTPPSWRSPRSYERVLTGDLDGDGVDELVASLRDGAGMMLLRWHDERLLPPLVLTGLTPGLVLDLDGDGDAEIVAQDSHDRDRIIVFGAGDQRLAPLPGPAAAGPVPAGIEDPAAIDAWHRADTLVELGVPRRTADELASFARLSGHVQEDILMRAAELYESTGADAQAAETYVAAAVRPELAERALAGAIRSRRRLGEFAAAAELARARRRLPGLVDAAADDELTALTRAAAPRPDLRWDFAAALDPMWRVDDPLAVRRDLGRRTLALWSTRTAVAADYPLEWDGEALTLTVDLEVDHIESSNDILIGVAEPDAAAPWLSLQILAQGSSTAPRVAVMSGVRGRTLRPLAPVGPGSRVRASVTLVPHLGVVIDEFTVDGEHERRVEALTTTAELPAAGPQRLVLGGNEALWDTFTGRVHLREVRISGATAGVRLDHGDPAALMLAEQGHAGAAAALQGATDGPALVWRIEALAALGRIDEAAALIASVPEDSPEFAALRHRLRRERDALTLAARAGLGAGYVDIVARDGKRPRTLDLVAALTDWPDRHGPPPPHADARERARHIAALALRGHAQWTFGHLDAAARDLADASAALADEPERPELASLRDAVADSQIRLSAARGDRAGLHTAIEAMLARSPIADIRLEVLMNDPQIRDLLPAERWDVLRRRHRPR